MKGIGEGRKKNDVTEMTDPKIREGRNFIFEGSKVNNEVINKPLRVLSIILCLGYDNEKTVKTSTII